MVFIAAVLLIGNIAIVPQFYGNSMAGQTNGQNLSGSNSTSQSDFIDLENLYSPYAILIDASSGEVISEYNSGDKIYPASLTKIMTAILAIEKYGVIIGLIKAYIRLFKKCRGNIYRIDYP